MPRPNDRRRIACVAKGAQCRLRERPRREDIKGLQYSGRFSDRQQSGPTSHHAWWEQNLTYQRAQSCPLGPITLGGHTRGLRTMSCNFTSRRIPLASVCRLSVRHIAHVSHVLFYCYFLVSLARIDTCLTWLTCLREAHLTCPMWSFRRMAPFGPCVPLSSLAHLAHLTACNRHVSHLAPGSHGAHRHLGRM